MKVRDPQYYECKGCGLECEATVNRDLHSSLMRAPEVCLYKPNDVGDYAHSRWVIKK